jgi:TRAP transporter TAXI family solute receptor
MNRRIFFGRSLKDILAAIGPSVLFVVLAVVVVVKFVEPAPPKHLVMTSGSEEGYYSTLAKRYQELLKDEGIDLEIRGSSGSVENLERLNDRESDVEAGFLQDGLGDPTRSEELESLGGLYYEPLWVFTRKRGLSRFSQLQGLRVAVGVVGGGTFALALNVLSLSGVDHSNTRLEAIGWKASAEALRKGEIDAALFVATDRDPLIRSLLADPEITLMNLDQAEAIRRHLPYLHHLVIPHGAVDLKRNIPAVDTHLVAPTATLLVHNGLHPALVTLLLKAANQIHSESGLFEERDEFPKDKDYRFPLNSVAASFYKSGMPFWHRYLPFWLATLIERFIFFAIPVLALLLPMIKLVPRIYTWRIRSRIFQRYGELKFLEAQMKPEAGYKDYAGYLERLDAIEERVNQMKVPLVYSDLLYILREHIEFVRGRLGRMLTNIKKREESAASRGLT